MRSPAMRLALAAALVVCAGGAGRARTKQPKEPAELTPAQQRAVDRLVEQLEQVRGKPLGEARVVQRAMKAGPPAVAAVERVLRADLTGYLARFRQQAQSISKARAGEVLPEEAAGLRRTVLQLQKQGRGLTKETIVSQGEPALKRLGELLLVERAEVLRRSAPLASQRRVLRGSGHQWERCAVYLYDRMPKDANKPEKPPSLERFLEEGEELLAGLTATMDDRSREILASNARAAAQLDPEEDRAILALNVMRNLLGLGVLAVDPKLCAAARDHSQDMRKLGFVGHISPVAGKTEYWDRAKRFGTRAHGENIAIGPLDGREANTCWFQSPVHHPILLCADYTRVGVGRTGRFFTELFGK